MKLLISLFSSSVGKKFLMAFTGLILLGFVVGHMVGNLQIFLGAQHLNDYAHFLKSMPKFLWAARLALLASVVLHIACAVLLTLENRRARPQGYADNVAFKASYASRTMIWSGFIILSFIIYHLLHFTIGGINSEALERMAYSNHSKEEVHDVYQMVVDGFSNPAISLFYIISIGLLCIHLSHGIQSLCQSLGLRTDQSTPLIAVLSKGIAWILFLGNTSMPLAVLLHIVR